MSPSPEIFINEEKDKSLERNFAADLANFQKNIDISTKDFIAKNDKVSLANTVDKLTKNDPKKAKFTMFQLMNMNRHQRRAMGKINNIRIPGLDLNKIMKAETHKLKIENGTIVAPK